MGREVDRGPQAVGREVDRGPRAVGRGPPGRGPAFSKTQGKILSQFSLRQLAR